MAEAIDRGPLVIGVRTAVLLGAVFVILLGLGAVEAVELVSPGELGPSKDVIEQDFGTSAVPAGKTGYDGQQFYAIARYFPDLEGAAEHLDAPRYRLLRILMPAVASIGGEGAPVVFIMVALNIVGCALASAGLAMLCEDRGWPPALGYLAPVPVIFGLIGSTADPLALGTSMMGLALAHRRQHLPAVVWFLVSTLTRETMAAVALGAAAGLWLAGDRPRWRLSTYLIPLAVIAGWYLILGQIVGGTLPTRTRVLGILDNSVPLVLLGMAALVVSLLGAWSWRAVPAVWPVALGFALWILIYTPAIFPVAALLRVSAPSLTIGLAAIAGTWWERRQTVAEG